MTTVTAMTQPATRDEELAGATGRALGRLMRVLSRAKAEAALSSGRTDFSAIPLLAALAHSGPIRSNALALAVYSDPSTVSRQVSALVEAGHVERRPDPDDRRAGLLALTDAGAAVLAARCRDRDSHLARVTAAWTEQDRASLAVLLDRLAADLAADLLRSADHAHHGQPQHAHPHDAQPQHAEPHDAHPHATAGDRA